MTDALLQLQQQLQAITGQKIETPPERDDLLKKWDGVQLHFLRSSLFLGSIRGRGDVLTLTEKEIRDSIDRQGNSVLDHLPNEHVGLGPFPEHLKPWDGDPVLREALLVADLENVKKTQERDARRAVHEKYGE